MHLTNSIFKIHSIYANKTNKKEADEFVRMLVSNIMGDLQDQGKFSPENLEAAMARELADFEKMSKKKIA